ncbi:hypothetical protein ACJMK2_020768 [Sinanodonta woodiana]|uniref:Carboxylic ester hydrolase n=1 Tax=Sinanodonta woodiana TaxID=1069815 RepID=A0ABD3U314_SINWO
MAAFLFQIVIYIIFFGIANGDSRVVNSTAGSIIGHTTSASFGGKTGKVYQYLGIPFAEPPTGQRRFSKPVPKAPFSSPFNASTFGKGCPQFSFYLQQWLPGNPAQSEDCLTINVFVPEAAVTSSKKYPVMIWIYGGAYVIGQAGIYAAENVAMLGEVVVVTFNYRLSALGFLSTEDDNAPGNFGLWDQRLAIKWVHDNIAAFGGDPHTVTIFGNSAGAASAITQALYRENQGYFKRIIVESGSPFCPWAFEEHPKKYAERLAKALNCPYGSSVAILDCLRKKSFEDIINNAIVGSQDEKVFRAEWVPVKDGHFLSEKPTDSYVNASGLLNIDLLIGSNSFDGAFVAILALQPYLQQLMNQSFTNGVPRKFFEETFIPMFVRDIAGKDDDALKKLLIHQYTDWSDPDNSQKTLQSLLRLSADYNFYMPVLRVLLPHAKYANHKNTYVYEFDQRSSFSQDPTYLTGANHGDEVPYVFGLPYSMAAGMHYEGGKVAVAEMDLSKKMVLMWTNFAKSGNPNSPTATTAGVTWPMFNLNTEQYIYLTSNAISVKSHLLPGRRDFWLNLEPLLLDKILPGHGQTSGGTPIVG